MQWLERTAHPRRGTPTQPTRRTRDQQQSCRADLVTAHSHPQRRAATEALPATSAGPLPFPPFTLVYGLRYHGFMHAHEQPGKAAAAPSSKKPLLVPSTDADHVSQVLALQRTLGNAATAELIEGVQRSSVHEVLHSAGRPLDTPVRQEMEYRLGADFSEVRVHTGTAAQRSAAEIGARAYTSGDHVVIGSGGADQHTLAHELTHVLQQRRGAVAGTDNGQGLRISDPADRFEREAEANAARAMAAPAPADLQRAPAASAVHGAGSQAPAVTGADGAAADSEAFVQRTTQYRTGQTTLDPDDDNYDSDADDFDENVFPLLPEPTPQETVRELWNSGSDDIVTLWRGTTLAKANAMAAAGSAGGITADDNAPRPGYAQAQIGVGGQLAEFTADRGVAEGYSYKSALVVVRVKASYLGKGSETESGWVLLGSAPVEVIAVVDRTRGQQPGSYANAS
jgi:uncharacterized protein DUF4157/uncharacterized protein DUF4765